MLLRLPGSLQEQEKLLETTLFVRCAAAMLNGVWTGVLQVDGGAGVGYEVDEGAGALRLRVAETEYSPGGGCVRVCQAMRVPVLDQWRGAHVCLCVCVASGMSCGQSNNMLYMAV